MVDIRLGANAGDEWNWNRGALIAYFSNQARSAGNAFLDATDNNGNVTMQEHYVPTDDAISSYAITLRDTYEYDGLNRLTQTNGLQRTTAGAWNSIYAQWYNYDQCGNRTINNGATWGNAINNSAYTVSTSTNRVNGMSYDFAGNVTNDAGNAREYDAENRMKKAWGSSNWNYYVYDADGKRVRRILGATETWQVYGMDGELAAEYPVNGAATMPQKEYGYRDGQMLIVGGCDVVRWVVADHLGTPRIEVDTTGSLASVRRHDYLPFGEELTEGMGNGSIRSTTQGYTADCVRQRFGSKERDTETGLDYFGTRYLTSVQGRFTSVDPLLLSAQITRPQTWNRYSYTLNNPLRFVDPTGAVPQDAQQANRNQSRSEERERKQIDFALAHPVVAMRVGGFSGDPNNITNVSARFTNRIGLQEGVNTFDGSQVNAARHVLWQAMITTEFNASIAMQVGSAHELNPSVDLSVREFSGNNALAEADQTIDLLNNQIGRDIGFANPGASPQQLTTLTLQRFHTEGLFTATQNADGTVSVVQTGITNEQFNNATNIIRGLNNNGRTMAEQQQVNEAARRQHEEQLRNTHRK